MTPLLNAAVYYFIFGVLMDTKHGRPGLRPVPGHRRLHLDLHAAARSWPAPAPSPATSASSAPCTSRGPRCRSPSASSSSSSCCSRMAALVVILLVLRQYPQPVLAAGDPGPGPAVPVQHGHLDGHGPAGRQDPGHRPADAVHPAHLDVRRPGVMWSIDNLLSSDQDLPHWRPAGPGVQPGRRLHRPDALRPDRQLPRGASCRPHVWAVATGWALLAGVGGFIYFWKAEETYGRG